MHHQPGRRSRRKRKVAKYSSYSFSSKSLSSDIQDNQKNLSALKHTQERILAAEQLTFMGGRQSFRHEAVRDVKASVAMERP